jgi:hypothetical protein
MWGDPVVAPVVVAPAAVLLTVDECCTDVVVARGGASDATDCDTEGRLRTRD